MNLKNISIALTVLVFGVIAMLFMQKGNYVNQAREHYEATTNKSFKGNSMVLDLVNNGIEMNKSTWAIACGALQTVRTSQDMARLEAKFFPATKGNMSLSNKTRRFEASSANVIVANFAKVEEDKKTGVKSLADLQSVDVSILLGNYAAAAAASDEGSDEEGAEE
ncbi:hypothetical protein [Fibrobacter sp. UWB7]|uniref:hypothetical protein n=1 Tax=Fibrobacter sp. UWB7 TaxID=1896206 RepID=UPI00090FBB4E|nr:hypothetical protein [Fibrobacter sp. UWB7]SHM53753.1 hypothetical protein SAMN05720467_1659 [Fibrobacter sp. UWB7]